MSGENQNQAPTPAPANQQPQDANAANATQQQPPPQAPNQQQPQQQPQQAQDANTPDASTAAADGQQKPVQEVQHVRIGAGQGAGVRVTQIAGGVSRRHLGKASDGGDRQDGISVPRASLQRLRDAIDAGRIDEARSTVDSWIGAVEAAESVPPPPAAEDGQQPDNAQPQTEQQSEPAR